MTFTMRLVNWVARKLGIQITLAGRRVGLVDDEFVAIWEKVRARGLTRYSIRCAAVAAVIFGLVSIFVGIMVRAERTDWTILFYIPLCFVIVALLAPIRWSQHEDRFLRLTAPWVVKRFD
jgi:hypothetical protein